MNYALYAQHRVRPSQNFRLTRKVINNMKKVCSLVVAVIASLMVTVGASATALDDLAPSGASQTSISQSATQPPAPSVSSSNGQQAVSNGDAVGALISGTGLDEESSAAAKELVSPLVKWVNIGIGIGVAVLGIILLAITALDLIYIVSPSFIRNLGSGGAAPQAGGMSPMGGMGGAAAPPPATGFASLISDDCKAALAEAGVGGAAPQAGGMSPMGGMGGMGGFGGGFGGGYGGGGFGGGFGGGAQAAPAPSKKAVAMVYLKKRVFTFVLIGVCAVVLTCTCFLDVGTWLGTQILNAVSGIGH